MDATVQRYPQRAGPRGSDTTSAFVNSVLTLPNGTVDGREKGIGREWFLKHLGRSAIHRQPAIGLIVVRCDENDRNARSRDVQVMLQLQAAHSGHSDIQNQAARFRKDAGFQEQLAGGECGDFVASRSQESLCRIPDRFVIVDHRD